MLSVEGYFIHELLHQNEKFAIYKGSRNSDNQKVILKVCHSDKPNLSDLVALQHEYQILKQLDLSGIIHVYELIQQQSQLILVLEDMEGISLEQFLAKGFIDLSLFFKIATQLVDAIGELHLQHIIHKDINPNNILINEKTLKVKLADFSISSELFQELPDHQSFIKLEGTLAYISPEQTGRMNRLIDYRSDFYSLGVTLYEMLTGRLPFKSKDTLELVHSHLTLIPEALTSINPNIPKMIEDIIIKLLSKSPEDRYSSAVGLKADLINCEQQWETNKKIKLFSLGQEDINDRLIISQKIYGREEQVDKLLRKYECVSQGKTEMILVSGYSGIGKTSLVKEIYRPIVRQQGYFLSGKYDQFQRSTPYSAIIEAFSEFIRQRLTESEDQLMNLRQSLLHSLGNNGQVIINIIPNLELIIGVQPHTHDLSPIESQNRLTSTFLDFVRALTHEHPLVLFLDDLQWIDNASLNLINMIISDNDLHYVLLIGAYRDNEVSENHPLTLMQQKLTKNGIEFLNLILEPLKQNNIEQLISDSLTSIKDQIPEFAKLLLDKTQGNPFFINEFLKKLYNDKLLVFHYQYKCWKWNIKEIQDSAITENVIDLLISRIYLLPVKTRELLELAACIGHSFDLLTLSIIIEKDLSVTAKHVLEATKAFFIVPKGNDYRVVESLANQLIDGQTLSSHIRYRFIHDKIQQAAYQMIPNEKKKTIHLKIGRLLLKDKLLTETDEQLFDILNHFNNSLDDITEIDEKIKLAQYNLWAGKKAKISSAYQAAKEYIEAGLKLLETVESNLKQELTFALSKELATCQYLTGEYEKAENSFNQLLLVAKEKLSTIEIYKLNCEMLSTLNRHDEAIQLGLKILATVNIKIPKNPNLLHILWMIFKIKLQIGGSKIQDMKFPLMESKQHQAIAELISQLYNSAFVTNQNLFVLFACTNVHLSLRYGYTNSTGFSCVVYAFIIMHGLNWYKEGLAFHELYQKLSIHYPQLNFEGKNEFVIGSFIDPWRLPLNKSFNVLQKAYQNLYDSGDLVYSNYSNLIIVYHSFFIGDHISETNIYVQNTINFIKKTKSKDFNQLTEFWSYAIKSMMENIFSTDELKKYEKAILPCKNNTEINFFYAMSIRLCYMFGHYDEAIHYGIQHEYYSRFALGLVASVEGYFYYSMAILSTITPSNKRSSLRKLKKIRSHFKRWANWCPVNYGPYSFLFDAEVARVNNNIRSSINYYHQALKDAEEQHFFNIATLVNERLGDFYNELSSPEVSQVYYKKAYKAYFQNGMAAKANEIQHKAAKKSSTYNLQNISMHHEVPESEFSLTSIDMQSLMKSSQVISSEIELEKLLQKLLILLLQNAGAHRVILLTNENNAWYVESEGTTSEQRISLSHTQTVEQRNDIPLSLIRYVQRVKKPVLIQTESDLMTYASHDEYISQTHPKSLLVIPVFYHGQLQSILYLENKTVSMAFKNEHVHTLQILSSQAAISLQNARLYYQATHDSLTGLSNRNLLYHVFNLLTHKSGGEADPIAIVLFDLDYFKIINDSMGHHIGDKVLLHVADILRHCLKKENLAVRLGGDEFVAMIKYQHIKEISDIIENFMHKLAEQITIDEHEINITTSIGISLYPEDGNDISELLKQADMALYRVKGCGKNAYQFYTTSLDQQIKLEYQQEIELRHALENNELCVYYQPVYSVQTQMPSHFEALLRWNHRIHGLISAKYFIPIAEKSGLIIPLGRWVLHTVLKQISEWQSANVKVIPIAVNISGLQFKVQVINEMIAELLSETQVNPAYLQLEFTESVSIEYTDKVLDDISKLRSLGIKLTLDDFGTYYSSLSYLREGIIDKLKIDQSFVKGINGNKSDKELIIAIINLAHSLNIKVVAEGVEDEEQMNFLIQHHADELQGYYLNEPMTPDKCRELLVDNELSEIDS